MKAQRRPGFTLIEIAISLVIIGVALVPAVNMWVAAAKANQVTDQETKALIVAQLIMESRVRVLPFTEQVSLTGTDADSGLAYALAVTAPTATTHRAMVTVTAPGAPGVLAQFITLTAKED